MSEIDRLDGDSDWIDLEFVERERTPREIIEKSIRYHLARLSLSNTVMILEYLGVNRSRVAVHNWVQKADLQPAAGESPDRVAVDQKAIRINDEPLRSQIVSATSIHRPLKRGSKPTPSGGIMLKLTRPAGQMGSLTRDGRRTTRIDLLLRVHAEESRHGISTWSTPSRFQPALGGNR